MRIAVALSLHLQLSIQAPTWFRPRVSGINSGSGGRDKGLEIRLRGLYGVWTGGDGDGSLRSRYTQYFEYSSRNVNKDVRCIC